MILNGTHYTVYETDSSTTITSRIAAMYNSLPKWLIISPNIPSTKDKLDVADITVKDFLSLVLNQSTLIIPPEPYPPGITREDVQDIFIATNKILEDAENRNDNSLRVIFDSIKYNTYKSPETLWRNRHSVIGALNKEILKNKISANEMTARSEEFDQIIPLSYTECELDRLQFTMDFGVYSGSLLKLFNNTTPNLFVPYITCATASDNILYKVYSNFRVNPDWVDLRLNNVILLKINSERIFKEPSGINLYKQYTNSALTITDSGNLLCTVDAILSGDRNITKHEYLDRILAVLGDENLVIPNNYQDNLVSTHFVIPNQCFDPVIFADIVMLNDSINKFMTVDEFMHASRISNNSIYIKKIIDENDLTPDAGSLTLKQTEYNGEYGMKSIGEWYVLCRLRTKTFNDAKTMQILLAKLLSIYNNEYDTVAVDYKFIGFESNKCIGKIQPTKRVQKIKGLKGLRAIEPEIFFPKFTRRCTNPPIVVNSRSDTVNEVMEFPIKSEKGRDGSTIKPRLYTCDTEEHKHIGLRINDLPNKKLFPYVPCCFAKNQSEKKGSAYRAYFYNEAIRKKLAFEAPTNNSSINMETIPKIRRKGLLVNEYPIEQIPTVTFTTPQNLREGDLLPVSPIIEKFFKLISMNPLKKFERCIIRDSRVSAIEAILLARKWIKYKRMRITTVNNRIQKEVSKIIANIDSYANAAKQELYYMTNSDIQHMLLTQRLSPTLFIRVLELLLDCNLFIFSDQELIVPPHSRMYIKYKPSRETFLLLEHDNGLVDLIGIRNTFGPPESFNAIFPPLDPIINNIYNVFRTMTTWYTNMNELQISKFSRMNVVGQIIDSHGKCRAFVIAVKSTNISLIPNDPLPPFVAPILHNLPRNTIKTVIESDIKNCIIIERRVKHQKTREVIVQIDSLIFSILTDDISTSNIPISSAYPKFDYMNATSAVIAYSVNKSKATRLLQDTINEILFNIKTESISLENALLKYAKSHGGFTANNKRLLYACRQWIKTHVTTGRVELISSVIETDTPMVYVLRGENAIKNLIETYNYDSTHVYNELLTIKSRYYFKPNMFDNIYLVVPVKTIEEAIEIIYYWLITNNKSPTLNPKIYAYIGPYKALTELTSGDEANECKILINPYIDELNDNSVNGRIMALLNVSTKE